MEFKLVSILTAHLCTVPLSHKARVLMCQSYYYLFIPAESPRKDSLDSAKTFIVEENNSGIAMAGL